MGALIIVLIVAGILAGLIQFFADYKGLPLYQPPKEESGFEEEPGKSTWQKIYDFIRNHWQFFGYIVIGVAGAFLVPVIGQFIELRGVSQYLDCIDKSDTTLCTTENWYLFVILGYGIILGYSSVRLIRSLGSFLLGNISKNQVEQQRALEKAQKEIDDLKAKLAAVKPNGQGFEGSSIIGQSLEGATPNSLDDDAAKVELAELAGFDGCNPNPNAPPWRDWRASASLKTLLSQVDALAPTRSKASDGMIGDLAHQSRESDHNPWVWDDLAKKGVVTALDITHDLNGKCDCQKLADSLEANKDSRVKYVIWNKRIMNSSSINGTAAWTWRPYSGPNPHTKHIHISVKCEKNSFDKASNWTIIVN